MATPISQMTDRLAIFQGRLPADTAVLLSDPADIQYLSGFQFLVPAEREGLLLVTRQRAFLIQASFSPTIENPAIQTLMGSHSSQLETHFKAIQKDAVIKHLWVDKTKLFADEYEVVQKSGRWQLQSFDRQLIWDQRMHKDEAEIALIIKASHIAAQAFQKLKPKIKPGVTEKYLQRQLDILMFEQGSASPAFPTIVAFGPHTALPHHQPTETVLADNTPALFDFGATYEGYRSDITRTLWVGQQPATEFTKLETIVTNAYQAVMTQLKNHPDDQLLARDLDEIARNVITSQGYGSQFIHTTGHGVGLDIHEQPSLYQRNGTLLTPGFVITVEPGIYLTGSYGYRYENTVVLTDKGYLETTAAA